MPARRKGPCTAKTRALPACLKMQNRKTHLRIICGEKMRRAGAPVSENMQQIGFSLTIRIEGGVARRYSPPYSPRLRPMEKCVHAPGGNLQAAPGPGICNRPAGAKGLPCQVTGSDDGPGPAYRGFLTSSIYPAARNKGALVSLAYLAHLKDVKRWAHPFPKRRDLADTFTFRSFWLMKWSRRCRWAAMDHL